MQTLFTLFVGVCCGFIMAQNGSFAINYNGGTLSKSQAMEYVAELETAVDLLGGDSGVILDGVFN